jgi:hypothetical protein
MEAVIYLIWAERGEYSDTQTKIVCYLLTRNAADETAKKLTDAEPKSKGRWDEKWRDNERHRKCWCIRDDGASEMLEAYTSLATLQTPA